MKSSKRIFKAGVPQHVYQRVHNHGVIFYRLEDYLLFYTIFCTTARRLNVKVHGLCLMINHIHSMVRCETKKTLSAFVSAYTVRFVSEYNKWKRRVGPLFVKPFGSAPKADVKKIMTCIAYLGNNPVLKKVCRKAEEFRWGFLPYAESNNPFSEPIVLHRASFALRKAITQVDLLVQNNKYLNYQLQERIFRRLNGMEKNQLIDYIISSYNVIDYQANIGYYGNYEKMILAINSNSGSEYDIEEEWDKYSDNVFDEMISITERLGYGGEKGFNFQRISEGELKQIAQRIYSETRASEYQIAKFLHIEPSYACWLVRR